MQKLFHEIELPLLQVLKTLEMNGVAVDTSNLGTLSKKINLELRELTDKLYALAGYSFNLNSPQQLAKLLFEELSAHAEKNQDRQFHRYHVQEALAGEYEMARS